MHFSFALWILFAYLYSAQGTAFAAQDLGTYAIRIMVSDKGAAYVKASPGESVTLSPLTLSNRGAQKQLLHVDIAGGLLYAYPTQLVLPPGHSVHIGLFLNIPGDERPGVYSRAVVIAAVVPDRKLVQVARVPFTVQVQAQTGTVGILQWIQQHSLFMVALVVLLLLFSYGYDRWRRNR
ncbi:hypothetical protein BM613_02955 [Sulfoacidibacillus thermotolerans]|uniref:Uncharacterized protein n=1 Tax=Sulfoacidibacillus thermotolerans TaxID=1765684 RepID=A0A2U3DB37_SULT2|nr:hypothetical protein BM613_02955 [Sulfoacidibacillus thermotolerans]